jgi:ABC-2 type transport system ATP-binding protein
VSEPAVVVDQVTKRFRLYHERNNTLKSAVMRRGRSDFEKFLAVDDVSLEMMKGKTFGLIGENGSGKSTLLKCLAKILRPDKGSIRVNGRMSALLELGAGFHMELTGRENVYLNAAILGLSKKEVDQRFDEIVQFAGIGKFIDNPVKNYSSGMYVRLGFAIAINVQPEVFLVDEVLAVGDEDFQSRCAEKFADMRRDGRTVVLVTHNLGSVRAMCDDAAWLHHGKLMATGRASDVVDKYLAHVRDERLERTKAQSTRLAVDGKTRRAAIERVELLDEGGRPTSAVTTLAGCSVRFEYRARDFGVPIRPVVSLSSSDGTWLANVQTGAPIPFEHDDLVHVKYEIPALPLQPGIYEVGIALKDPWLMNTHVQVDRCLRFEVRFADDPHMAGLVNLGGHWSSGVSEAMPEDPPRAASGSE